MQGSEEVIKKIESPYVGEDCVQCMFPYSDSMTLISQDGILFHHKQGSDYYVNMYIEDERRKQFPYSNIPTHIDKNVLYTNQVLDFNKPYLRIADGHLIEYYVIKDNKIALLISKKFYPKRYYRHMTYNELLEFLSSKNTSNINQSNEKIYYIFQDGGLVNYEYLLPSIEKIHNFIKNNLSKFFSFLDDKLENDYYYESSSVGQYLKDFPWILPYIKEKTKEIDFSLINFNVRINDPFYIVKINDNKIEVKGINILYVKDDDYEVSIYDIPIRDYSLEQLKLGLKLYKIKEPRIPLKSNYGVSKEDIINAKEMVKTLKRK